MASKPSRLIRVKKLSRTQIQSVIREDQLDKAEYESLHIYKSETDSGVERNEIGVCIIYYNHMTKSRGLYGDINAKSIRRNSIYKTH